MMNIKELVALQRAYFLTDITKSYEFRLDALRKLKCEIKSNEKKICDALYEDLNKSSFEGFETEVAMVIDEIAYQIRHLRRFMHAHHVPTPLAQFPSRSYYQAEPYGVALIMSPWNYPFQLTMEPLAGAIAAGNTVILKPSDYSRNTSNIMADIIHTIYPNEYISVVLGGRDANKDLLNEPFDYIFFTGGVTVGKLVMQSASNFLTPVTLELGGKSPCIVDNTADLKIAAKRIAWGKFLNAGQTCVAPDYLYVHSTVKDELIKQISQCITEFYTQNPLTCTHLPKIINQKHFERLQNLLTDQKIVFGGNSDSQTLKIEPTLVDFVTFDSEIMQSEIFGPLLPILTFEKLDDAIKEIKSRPRPLSLYLFSQSKENMELVTSSLSYGGGCINDTIVHLASSDLPFGGVGGSGMGSYHGKTSFDTFSHYKSILHKSAKIDLPIRYLPPTPKKFRQLRKFIGHK
ncbi:MAG: aldehyde dehydrogenase [Christensenellaceae bacterium]